MSRNHRLSIQLKLGPFYLSEGLQKLVLHFLRKIIHSRSLILIVPLLKTRTAFSMGLTEFQFVVVGLQPIGLTNNTAMVKIKIPVFIGFIIIGFPFPCI